MKKILAITIVAALTLALCIGISAKDADQWLGGSEPGGNSTGWWMNPISEGCDKYINISFKAAGYFSGIHGFYLCNPAAADVGPTVVKAQILQDGNVLAEKEIPVDGDKWYDTDFGKSFPAGDYTLAFLPVSGNGGWFVLGSYDGQGEWTIDTNCATNGDTKTHPEIMLIGADAPSQGGSSSGSEAAFTLTPSKLGEFFEGSTGVNTVTAEVKEGGEYITFTAEGEDPFFAFPEPVEVGVDAKYAVIKYRYAGEGERTIDFYLKIAEPHARTASIETDGAWHYAIIDCSVPYPETMDCLWDGTIARFDPLSGNGITGTSIDIASIAFYTSEADARAAMTDGQQGGSNPGTADASVIAVAAVACIALAGVVVAKKVR